MRTLKWLGFGVGALVALAAAGIGVLALRKPAQRVAKAEPFERSPARLARGDYLVNHVAHCLGCHSGFLWDRLGFPPAPGTLGQGGYPFDQSVGVPGLVCAQNITPDPDCGLGKWTDDEVARAIREGVDRNGDALFPMMPYPAYRSMSDEDVRSVVVYLRTLAPVRHDVPKKQIDFPVNLLVKGAPQPVEAAVETPDDKKDHHAYGAYLVTLAGCRECHTPHDTHGQLVPGREFSGGWVMNLKQPDGKVLHVVPPNLTPDPGAYFGIASKADWIGRVKAYAGMEGEEAPLARPGRNTVMGWAAYAGMTEADLGAIYDYLKTVPPIANKVEPFPDAVAEAGR